MTKEEEAPHPNNSQ